MINSRIFIERRSKIRPWNDVLHRNQSSPAHLLSPDQNLPRKCLPHRLSPAQNWLPVICSICLRRRHSSKIFHLRVLNGAGSPLFRKFVDSVVTSDEVHAWISVDNSALDIFVDYFIAIRTRFSSSSTAARAVLYSAFFPRSAVLICIAPGPAVVQVRVSAEIVVLISCKLCFN